MRILNTKLLALFIALTMTLSACGGGSGGGDDDGGNSGDSGNSGENTGGENTSEENYTTNGVDSVNPPANRSVNGSGATLTMFTFGIDIDHDEFDGLNIAGSYGATDENGAQFDTDTDTTGLGTFYAGLAVGQNLGVAPAASINNVRPYESTANRRLAESREALAYTVDNFDTDVFLFTYDVSSSVDFAEFKIDFENAVNENDWLVTITGGPLPESATRPGTYNPSFYADDPAWGGRMIVVGAVDESGELLPSSTSAYTPGSYAGDELGGHFIVAPGQSICSSAFVQDSPSAEPTVCEGRTLDGDVTAQSSYLNATGVAPALALVSGAATAVRGQYPSLDAATVVDVLLCSADDLGEPGYDDVFGAGRLNVQAAMELGQTLADGGDFGDCDVPEETPAIDFGDEEGGNDSTDLPGSNAVIDPQTQASVLSSQAVTGQPGTAGVGESGCTAYVLDDSGLVYFRDRRGNYSVNEADCMAPLN